MSVRGRWSRALGIVLLTVAVGAGAPASPSSAIAYGEPVTRPQATVPWVVALYQSEEPSSVADLRDMICTATALDARTVLTAAHCVEDLGADVLQVGYGASRLRAQRLVGVASFDVHPEYDSLEVTNDVAVLHTAEDLAIGTFPVLAEAAQVARAKRASTRLLLYGWGLDERDRLTGRLERARLKARTKAAKKEWGSSFDPALQLAAGATSAKARKYPGACEGDSGGPLTMIVRGRPAVVGITSFGKGHCGVRSPTIFTSVGRYRAWIDAAVAGQVGAPPSPGEPQDDPVESELPAFDPLPADPGDGR